MKMLISRIILFTLIPYIHLIGLTYDQYSVGYGSIPSHSSLLYEGLDSWEFLINGKSQALTFLNSYDLGESEEDGGDYYPFLFDARFDNTLKKLPLPIQKFETSSWDDKTIWDFKDKYILGTYHDEESEHYNIFLYDIELEEMIDFKQLAKSQGVDMYGPDDDEGCFLTMNDFGVVVGSFWSTPGYDNNTKLFAYYPDLGLKIIELDELLIDNEYWIHDEWFKLNNQGQFIFQVYTKVDSYWDHYKWYIYDQNRGVVELEDLYNKAFSLFAENKTDGSPYITSFNDEGDILLEYEGDDTVKLYHYNIHTEILSFIDETILNENSHDFLNNRGDIVYEKGTYTDVFDESEEFFRDSVWEWCLWNSDSNHSISIPFDKVFSLDDYGRIIGLDDQEQFVIWSKGSGIQLLGDLINLHVESGEIEITDISVSKNGEILLEYYQEEGSDSLMLLVPKD